MSELDKLCAQVLRDNLPAGLKAAVDRLLERGVSKAHVLMVVRRTARPGPDGRGRLTILAVEAYLEGK